MRIGMGLAIMTLFAGASSAAAQQPTIEDLMRRLDALQQRVNELEAERRRPRIAPAPPPAAAPRRGATRTARPDTTPEVPPVAGGPPPEPPPSRSPEVVRAEVDEALRGSLDGLSMRVPNTDTTVRLYGFVRLTGYYDFDARNQTDAAAVQGIPLTGSRAAGQQGGGDITARGSRVGVDTRTETAWGRLDTTVEADFRGEISPGGDLAFRLRLAFAELTRGDWSYLIGQANSLWNEGLIEAFHDATNLNQSFIRQAQLRATHRFDQNWTLAGSIEAPYGDITTVRGPIFGPGRLDGGASPVFDQMPDFLARLTYRDGSTEAVLRGLVRRIGVDTDNTTLQPGGDDSTLGWGLAAHARLPVGAAIPAVGRDELTVMGYYGQGIGRYLAGNSFGQGAVTNFGVPSLLEYSLDAVPSYGGLIAYRRFWNDTLRSTFSYAYARQDFPDSADAFAPGTLGALALNREMQQVIANIVWSPFADRPTQRQPFGWLDLGLEYVFSRRDLENGAGATGGNGIGHGIANRIVAFGLVRF
ncbi:DcaP family trimeric outer membrane transporter [Falsiroseomonas sp.]|uniref:DcaP family trimeric outer membrane transporter n=1 Tax=Falsiroseomonas sp. TaxID=2870721 RepID=UPI00356B0C3F